MPNEEQQDYWNADAGQKWVRMQEQLDAQLEHIGAQAISALAPAEDERVVDIGCGCGATTLALAELVGPGGAVTGLDISRPMLDRARERAKLLKVANVEFVAADAQSHAFAPGDFDGIFSRFGVMFFADSTAAFANLRTALRRDGRMAFACWQGPEHNPWLVEPAAAAAAHIELRTPESPESPGPFAFADGNRVKKILTGAGFRNVEIRPFQSGIAVGGDVNLDQAVDFLLELGPFGNLADADEITRGKTRDAVRDVLARYQSDDGIVMQSSAWIVQADA